MEHEPDNIMMWTGVGGLPFESLSEAVDHVLAHYPRMPFLPEPCIEGAGLLTDALPPSLGRARHAGFGVKLTAIGAEDSVAEAFAITNEGLATTPLLQRLRRTVDLLEERGGYAHFKGQIPGAVTLLRYVRDTGGIPLWAYPELRDVLAVWCAALAREVALSLLEVAESVTLWIDEPGLGLPPGDEDTDEVLAVLQQTLETLNDLDVATGIHCCGHPPLDLVRLARPDWLHVDVLQYGEELLADPESVTGVLDGGTNLALGCLAVMPFKEDASPSDFIEALARAVGRPVGELLPRLALAPSCGTMLAPLDRELAIAETLAKWSGELTARGNR